MGIAFWIFVSIAIIGLLLAGIGWIFSLRTVVPPNEVHIVSQGNKTFVYGNTTANGGKPSAGNSYYRWPQSMPHLGVVVTRLPVSDFEIWADNCMCPDRDGLPFMVDIKGFFYINDYELAAARTPSFGVLRNKLADICRSAARTVFSQGRSDEIIGEYSKYNAALTQELSVQLKSWGISPAKPVDVRNMRDNDSNGVIDRILRKRKEVVERELKIKEAQDDLSLKKAELAAKLELEFQQKQNDAQLDMLQAEIHHRVGIAKHQAEQGVLQEGKKTKACEMDVIEVEKVRQAEIAKETTIIAAEAAKRKAELDAEGIKAEGFAKAAVEEAMQMASVHAQTALAKEIGEMEGYLKYLTEIRRLEATEKVGVEQAKAINGSNIKVVATTGNVADGIHSAFDVLTPKGGANIATALETLAGTEAGQALLAKLGLKL